MLIDKDSSVPTKEEPDMAFFAELRSELGHQTGKGIGRLVGGTFTISAMTLLGVFDWVRPKSWKTIEGESSLRHNTWRIAFLSFIVACMANSNLVVFSFTHPDENENSMNVLVQLDSDEDIGMQRKEMFIPVGSKDESLVQYEGFAVMKYKRSWVGNSPTIYIPKKTCLLIPAGEQVHLRLEGPPKQVFNMHREVTFFTSPRAEPHTRLDQLVWAVLGKPKALTTNWREMRDQWDEVDDKPFHAKALMARYIPYPHAGGRVCV
jgi:hypothetical protein